MHSSVSFHPKGKNNFIDLKFLLPKITFKVLAVTVIFWLFFYEVR